MNPIEIKIEVNFGEKSLQVLSSLAGIIAAAAQGTTATTGVESAKTSKATPASTKTQKAPEKPAEAPKAEATQASADEDMPEEIAEAAVVPDDVLADEVRATVEALKSAGKPTTTIRTDILSKYGVAKASELKDNAKRALLIADLKALRNAK